MQKLYHFLQRRNENKESSGEEPVRSQQELSLRWFLWLLGCIPALITPSFSWAQTTTELSAVLAANQASGKQGDLVPFRLQLKANALENPLVVQFKLPLGFEWVPGQLKTSTDGVNWQAASDPVYQGAASFKWQSASFSGNTDVWISFVLRMKSGSALGNGTVQVNIESGAVAKQTSVSLNVNSRLNQAYVADAFDQRACVIGTVWLDCNDDGAMSADELAIPGVRLYLEDGMSVTTDREGLYSVCGLSASTHVLKVDKRSLPYGVVLDVENSRNASNPNSKFVDLKYGEMHRADFKSVSCSVPVMNRVLSRIEAASSVDMTHYVEKMPDAFLSGASFNSDEDRLQVIEPCGEADDRIVCVQKQREIERQQQATKAEEERLEKIRQQEQARIAKEQELKRQAEQLEIERAQKAEAERQRLDANLRKAKDAQARLLEQQKEALQQELDQEMLRREKLLQQQDALSKKELERKRQEIDKQANQSLKFNDIKSPQNENSGVQLESIDLDPLLEFNEINETDEQGGGK